MNFRKKPVVIEAFEFDPSNNKSWPEWFAAKYRTRGISLVGFEARITTLEGVMTASPGDWVIQGVKGEIYPCKPDIFAATYEPVSS